MTRARAHLGAARSPTTACIADDGDPAEVAAARESIRLAFVAALQHLPARQRAVLILREVLRWQATRGRRAARHQRGVGQQRAAAGPGHPGRRSTSTTPTRPPVDAEQQALLARYVDAFERYDMTSLVALLHDDAVMSMPPYDFWLQGPEEMARLVRGRGAAAASGSRLVPPAANGCAGFGQYRADAPGRSEPWALQVIEVSGGRIVGHHNFLDPELFAGLRPAPAPSPAEAHRPGQHVPEAHQVDQTDEASSAPRRRSVQPIPAGRQLEPGQGVHDGQLPPPPARGDGQCTTSMSPACARRSWPSRRR